MKLSRAMLLVASLCAAQFASAQVRVGVINQYKIRDFVASPAYQKIAKLHGHHARKEKLMESEKKLEEMKKKYQDEKDKMSFEQKQTVRRKLVRLAKLIKEKKESYQKKEKENRKARRKRLREQWDESVKAVAKRRNINVVLERQGVYYADAVINITDDVAKEILKNMKNDLPKHYKHKKHHKMRKSA